MGFFGAAQTPTSEIVQKNESETEIIQSFKIVEARGSSFFDHKTTAKIVGRKSFQCFVGSVVNVITIIIVQ